MLRWFKYDDLTLKKAGVNGLLDVARQVYKEANADAFQLVTNLGRSLPPLKFYLLI